MPPVGDQARVDRTTVSARVAVPTPAWRPPSRAWKLTALICVGAIAFVAVPAMRTEAGTAALVIVFCLFATGVGAVPLFALPVLLALGAPLLLLRYGSDYAPWNIVAGSVHPVLLTFACGLAFAVVAKQYGLDQRFINFALLHSRGRFYRLATLIIVTTVWLSAWISNIAAAGLVFAAIAPAADDMRLTSGQKRSLLLLIAVAANLGGMTTPVGTGANAVAIAAVAPHASIGFVRWILFAAPLSILLIAVAGFAIRIWLKPDATMSVSTRQMPVTTLPIAVPAIFIATVMMWLLEPLHGIPSHWVSGISLALMAITRVMKVKDFTRLDWGVLLLITAGIGFGYLVEASGLATTLIRPSLLRSYGDFAVLLVFCSMSALLSGVMSNTGAAAALIPVAASILPSPSTAILIALATGLGFPFAISTPANALAVRHGASQMHLFVIGSAATIGGSILLALTGKLVLAQMGVP